MRLSLINVFGVYFLLMACATEKQVEDFSALSVKWTLESNLIKDEPACRAVFTLYNNGSVPLNGNDWSLFFNQTNRRITGNPSSVAQVRQVIGDFYELKPKANFTLAAGDSIEVPYECAAWLIKESDAPHGLYWNVQDENGASEQITVANYTVRPFIKSEQLMRHKGDQLAVWTAEEEYKRNKNLLTFTENQLLPIIPSPQVIQLGADTINLDQKFPIHYPDELAFEAQFLAAKMGELYSMSPTLKPTDERATNGISLTIDSSRSQKEGYTLNINAETGITITGNSASGAFYGIQSLLQLVPISHLEEASDNLSLREAKITDVPRFEYRGMHLDVGRNFFEVGAVKKLMDAMAFYKLNKLHLHLTEDEGWRLDIPDLPELVEVGARRGHTIESSGHLHPAYGSGADPDDANSGGNGYYTKAQFIDLIQYAHQRHIEVIPEINVPGHARAAIKSMEARYQKYMGQDNPEKAAQYLLSDLEDQSEYRSVQDYPDNVICVCQESVYTFYEKVIDEIIKMYQEAEVPLYTIHTGGDEVPVGVWMDAPICKNLMAAVPEINTSADLSTYFLKRINEILSSKKLITAGWEEVAMLKQENGYIPHPDFVDKNVVPYVWQNLWGNQDLGYRLANAGYPVVLCNVTNLYFDLAYSNDPRERGFYWGGFIDTKKPYELLPFDVFKSTKIDPMGNTFSAEDYKEMERLKPSATANILGIQGALWSETIKTEEMLEYYYMPKLLGLAERAWSKQPEWAKAKNEAPFHEAWSQFASTIAQKELPILNKLSGGYQYRIPTPGAMLKDGQLYANLALPGMTLRYTTDGSEPNGNSTLYTKPVAIQGEVIKISAFNKSGRNGFVATIKQ